MLHAPTAAAPPPPPTSIPAVDPEVARARAYIAAVRDCGLVIVPWQSGGKLGNMVCLTGQEIDGPNDFSAGTDRLLRHPDGRAAKGCRKGLVFELLCEDFGVDPDDPYLCDRINERMLAAYPDRVAS